MGAAMKQGTTYPITLTFEGIDLTSAEWVIVTIKPMNRLNIEITGDALNIAYGDGATTIAFALTQQESLSLPFGTVIVDCNWMIDGVRGGAHPTKISITENYLRRAVE